MEQNEQPEQAEPTPEFEDKAIEKNVKSRSTWMRLLFMIICGFIYGLTRLVVFAVVVLQFLWLLFTGSANQRLASAGQSLATYTYQLVRYLTFCTDERPFPFDDDWPSTKPL